MTGLINFFRELPGAFLCLLPCKDAPSAPKRVKR